jgi:hypothetical protein
MYIYNFQNTKYQQNINKLEIECDESGHYRDIMKNNDIIRENDIKTEIKDIYFIRYRPEEKDFNIFNLVNQIYQFIRLN